MVEGRVHNFCSFAPTPGQMQLQIEDQICKKKEKKRKRKSWILAAAYFAIYIFEEKATIFPHYCPEADFFKAI